MTTQTALVADETAGIESTLSTAIINVVAGICRQDSTDRGAWTFVVTRRVSLDHGYFEQAVASAIEQMLKTDVLYTSHTELFDNSLRMNYLKVGGDKSNE